MASRGLAELHTRIDLEGQSFTLATAPIKVAYHGLELKALEYLLYSYEYQKNGRKAEDLTREVALLWGIYLLCIVFANAKRFEVFFPREYMSYNQSIAEGF